MSREYTAPQLKGEVEGYARREHSTTAWLRDGWRIRGEGWLYDLTFDVANWVFGWPILNVVKSVVSMFVSLFNNLSR